LQHIEIFFERLHACVFHLVPSPPHQRGALVPGEVDASGVPQVAQEGFERLVALIVHLIPSACSSDLDFTQQ
jgi:hypothetical protein